MSGKGKAVSKPAPLLARLTKLGEITIAATEILVEIERLYAHMELSVALPEAVRLRARLDELKALSQTTEKKGLSE